MKKVNVLLSTYNGERYLNDQINSILSQKGVDVELFVRDDGSTDNTLKLVRKLVNEANITVGKNIGWKLSFSKLLNKVPYVRGDYYAFADQDDIWEPSKLSAALERIHSGRIAEVYHSNVAIVDDNLNFVGNRFPENFVPNRHFPESFFDGWGVGATMVFNDTMLQLVQQYFPEEPTNHDALVMALGNIAGNVYYDAHSHIMYRRHVGTATGFGTKVSNPTLLDRYKRYRSGPKNQFSVRAREILNGYYDVLSPLSRRVLSATSDYQSSIRCKLWLLLNPRIKATGVRKTLQLKYRILVNSL